MIPRGPSVTSFLEYVLILVLASIYKIYLQFLMGNCTEFSVVFKSLNHISQLSHDVSYLNFKLRCS